MQEEGAAAAARVGVGMHAAVGLAANQGAGAGGGRFRRGGRTSLDSITGTMMCLAGPRSMAGGVLGHRLGAGGWTTRGRGGRGALAWRGPHQQHDG